MVIQVGLGAVHNALLGLIVGVVEFVFKRAQTRVHVFIDVHAEDGIEVALSLLGSPFPKPGGEFSLINAENK